MDSGFRVLRRLSRSSVKRVPVVVCSKYISNSDRDEFKEKALAYGAVCALPKIPFPQSEDFLRHAREFED